MNTKQIYNELLLQIDKNIVTLDAPMKEYTSFKTGGNAAIFIQPRNVEELSRTVKVLTKYEIKHLVMGNGTNLLVKDAGYSGVIIKIGEAFNNIEIYADCTIEAGAGALLSNIAKVALEASLTGFEFASGIPGSIGGAVFMNAGAYDGEISQVLKTAEVLTKDGTRSYTISANDMNLSYRHSIFQETGDIITKVTLLLTKGDKEQINKKMNELKTKRNEKQPLENPSAGSFFKRPQGNYAGKLIHDAGLRGLSLGGAQISPLHAGFIINTGEATATEIINLMEIVKSTVYDQSGVMLEPEVKIIGD